MKSLGILRGRSCKITLRLSPGSLQQSSSLENSKTKQECITLVLLLKVFTAAIALTISVISKAIFNAMQQICVNLLKDGILQAMLDGM